MGSALSSLSDPLVSIVAWQIAEKTARKADKDRYEGGDFVSGIKEQIRALSDDPSWAAEAIWFTAADGLSLRGVLCAKTQRCLSTASSALLVVDGTGGKMTADPDKLVKNRGADGCIDKQCNFARQYLEPFLATDGPDVVLLYEWRNYGASRGSEYKNTLGFSECRDVLGALEALLTRYSSLDCEKIGVVGVSAGNAAVVNAAARLRRNHPEDHELDRLRAIFSPEKMGHLQQASFRWMYLDTFPIDYLDTVAKQVQPIHRKISRIIPCLSTPRVMASRAFEQVLKRSRILGPEERLDPETGALVKPYSGTSPSNGSCLEMSSKTSRAQTVNTAAANMLGDPTVPETIPGLFLNRKQSLQLAMENPKDIRTNVKVLHCKDDPYFEFDSHQRDFQKLGIGHIEFVGYSRFNDQGVALASADGAHSSGAALQPSILLSWWKEMKQ